jgi:cytochrome c-type biogenesis protein
MNSVVTLPLAFAAGLLSFLSPCVLPLIPSYLGLLGGAVVKDAGQGKSALKHQRTLKPQRWPLLLSTLFFVLGFTLDFVVLSILSSSMFFLLGSIKTYITVISGLIVIVLGLNVMFDFLKLLNYEKRFHLKHPPRGFLGTFLAGLAFGAGWTPCIGPVLASILMMASNAGEAPLAALYLLVFSAGLALPFLLAAVFFDSFSARTAFLRRHLGLVQKLSGLLLVIIGILILTGRFAAINSFLARY